MPLSQNNTTDTGQREWLTPGPNQICKTFVELCTTMKKIIIFNRLCLKKPAWSSG